MSTKKKNQKKKKTQKLQEKELVEILDAVVKKISPKFVFGYHSIEDIEQQARLLGLQALPRWDGERSLYNFLYTHIKNRLCTYKRDNYERLNTPCEKCPFNAWIKYNNTCKVYERMDDCSLYYKWLMRNSAKKNIMQPIGIPVVCARNEEFMEMPNDVNYAVLNNEMKAFIEARLNNEQRKVWLKLMSGQKIRCYEQEQIKDVIEEWLTEKEDSQ